MNEPMKDPQAMMDQHRKDMEARHKQMVDQASKTMKQAGKGAKSS